MAGNDKRLYKLIANDGTELQALSPPQTYIGSPVSGTPTVGPNAMPVVFVRSASTCSAGYHSDRPQLCNTINKKILFHLISTLNTAFHPDYDFTDARSDEFSLEPSLNWTMSSVKSNLSAALGDGYSLFEQQLWSAIEEEIQLKECEIYRSVYICVMLCDTTVCSTHIKLLLWHYHCWLPMVYCKYYFLWLPERSILCSNS